MLCYYLQFYTMNNTAPHFKIGIQVSEMTNDAMGGGTEKVCELYFTDAIFNRVSFWTGGEISMLQECIDKVNACAPDKIIQYIDSWGGSAPVGFGIYNYLKGHKAKVETKILNNCASIASVMAMAGNKGKISMPVNGMMVIHQAQNSAQGTSADLREAADLADKYTEQVIDVYVRNNRKGKTAEELMACIQDGDYWMTGQEALDMGFVDSVYNDESVTITNSIAHAKTLYNNIPQRILNMAAAEATSVEAEVPQEHKNFFTNLLNQFTMKVTDIINGIKPQITAAVPAAEGQAKMEILLTNLTDAINTGVQADIQNAVTTALTEATTSVTDAVAVVENKYKGVLDALTTKVDTLTNSVGTLTASLNTANETITAQATTITALTADVQKVQGQPAKDADKPTNDGKPVKKTFADYAVNATNFS